MLEDLHRLYRGFLQRDASMRAPWSDRQNSSPNMSQNVKRIRPVLFPYSPHPPTRQDPPPVHPKKLDFGPFRLRFGSVSGPFGSVWRRFGSFSGHFGYVRWGRGEGLLVREKNITMLNVSGTSLSTEGTFTGTLVSVGAPSPEIW